MTTFAPPAARASELSRCARMCALRIRGHSPSEYDELTRRYFARGHLYSDYVCLQLEAKHGRDNVEREVPIDWPLGVGHADAFVKPERLLVEVKSTVTPTLSSPMFDMAVEQLRIYLRFYEPAEHAALILINPSDLSSEDVFAVRLTDEDVERIDRMVDDVRAAAEGGELPERVCAKPSQARGRLCDFADPCFDGWEPDPDVVVDDPAAMDAASRLYAAKQKIRAASAETEDAKAEKTQAEAELAELLGVGDTVCGPWSVRRTHVQRASSFSMKAAAAAGFPVHTLDEFLRPGAEYDTWTVRKAEVAGEVDFGEVPFD